MPKLAIAALVGIAFVAGLVWWLVSLAPPHILASRWFWAGVLVGPVWAVLAQLLGKLRNRFGH